VPFVNPSRDIANTITSNISFPGISSEHEVKQLPLQKVNGQFKGNALSNRPPKMSSNAFRLSDPNVAMKAFDSSGNMIGVLGSSVLSGNVLQVTQTAASLTGASAGFTGKPRLHTSQGNRTHQVPRRVEETA
jgi:hypothetical protein